MPTKVLHVIGSLRLGGAQVVLKHIVENSSKDFEHIVYPLRPKDPMFDLDATVIQRNWPNYDPRKFFEIIRLVNQENIDILAVHLTKPIMGGLLASRFCDAKVVVHEHGPLVRKGLQYSFYRFMLKRLWKRASAFIAVSNNMRDELINIAGVDPAMITVVPNAVDLDEFDPEKTDPKKTRDAFQVQPTDIVIGYAGRLASVKGVDVLLKAAAKLPDKFKLVLAGSGSQENNLKQLAKDLSITDSVKFMGFCDDITNTISGFDIGVIPSRQESFGIVGIEMMRMNVPVISTGVDGMADYMIDGQNAIIFGVDNPDQLAQSIQKLASDDQLRHTLKENAAKTAQNFSIQKCVTAIEKIYTDIQND